MPRTNGATSKDETSAQVFVRLAESRTNKTITNIRNIGNLGHYEHTPASVTKIFATLRKELDDAEAKIKNPKQAKSEPVFKL